MYCTVALGQLEDSLARSGSGHQSTDRAAQASTLKMSKNRKRKKTKRKNKNNKQQVAQDQSPIEPSNDEAGAGDIHPAIDYLRKWKHDRSSWSFKKIRQVWLLKNMMDADKVDLTAGHRLLVIHGLVDLQLYYAISCIFSSLYFYINLLPNYNCVICQSCTFIYD